MDHVLQERIINYKYITFTPKLLLMPFEHGRNARKAHLLLLRLVSISGLLKSFVIIFYCSFLLFFKSLWVIFLMSAPDREINSNFLNLCVSLMAVQKNGLFFSLQRMFGSFDLSPNSNIID